MTTKTIDPQHAADLFDLYDDHELLHDDPVPTAHGYAVLGSVPTGEQKRWHEQFWMLLRDADNAIWGVEYGVGLTENQEDSHPWKRARGPIPMRRLYEHIVIQSEWRTTPQEVTAS